MRLLALTLSTVLLVGPAAGVQPAKSGSKSPSPGPKAAAPKKPSSSSQARARSTKATKTAAAKSRARRSASWRSGQQVPSRERYAEIQQALIARGYLTPPATGSWGPESVEALKRFQKDHNLEASGKLTALTLIALGLGPNRASSSRPATAGSEAQAPERP